MLRTVRSGCPLEGQEGGGSGLSIWHGNRTSQVLEEAESSISARAALAPDTAISSGSTCAYASTKAHLRALPPHAHPIHSTRKVLKSSGTTKTKHTEPTVGNHSETTGWWWHLGQRGRQKEEEWEKEMLLKGEGARHQPEVFHLPFPAGGRQLRHRTNGTSANGRMDGRTVVRVGGAEQVPRRRD